MSNLENQRALDREDVNNTINRLRQVMRDIREMKPLLARAMTKEDLPQEFISPSTPVIGGLDPTDPNFTGSFVSGRGRTFTVGSTDKVINIGGVKAGVLQFGGSQEDGSFCAGAGAVCLDVDGITIDATPTPLTPDDKNVLKFVGADSDLKFYTSEAGGANVSFLWLDGVSNASVQIISDAEGPTSSSSADVKITARTDDTESSLTVDADNGITIVGSIKTQGEVKAVAIKSGNYTLTTADNVVVFTATATATLPNDPPVGQTYRLICRAGDLTIDGDSSDTIKGELTQTITAGEDLIITYTETGVWE